VPFDDRHPALKLIMEREKTLLIFCLQGPELNQR